MATLLLLLGVALASALIVRYVRLPYTVVLVVVGFGLGLAKVQLEVALSRDLILHVFLPLLLFEATLDVNTTLLRRALLPIMLLAVPGVLVSTLLIGWGLQVATGLTLSAALLFGALVSATDPVAVLATFKRLHVTERLAVLVEGESVVNDGTALVLFSLLLPAAQGQSFNPALASVQFAAVVLGGMAIGSLVGWLGARASALFDDHLAELTLSVLVAYGSFLASERLQLSGVIACISAGLVFATRSGPYLTSTARTLLVDVWEFAAFLGNSLLFVLIGVTVALRDYQAVWRYLLWAVVLTLLARVLVVYGCGMLLRWLRRPFLWRQRLAVVWSGLRGALALALALSLPVDVPQRTLLLRLTAGVVLFTLLIQGSSVELLLSRRRPCHEPPTECI